MEHSQKVLLLSKAIQATFTSSEWTELSHLTDSVDYVDNHPRLLRSLYWGDDDYKGCALDAVSHILKRSPANLRRIVEYGCLHKWLSENEPGPLRILESEFKGIPEPVFVPVRASQAARDALEDAQSLLHSRGPASAIDRVHTAMHAFLQSVCSEAGLLVASDATPNQLLKAIVSDHPAFHALGPRADDLRKILRSSGAILDAFGTLRNNASRVHPNDDVLDDEAALFVINVARSLLRFLDCKLASDTPF